MCLLDLPNCVPFVLESFKIYARNMPIFRIQFSKDICVHILAQKQQIFILSAPES